MTSATGLVRYDAMRKALAECVRVDEARDIKNKAEALRAYAQQRDDKQAEGWFEDIKVRAIGRIGDLTEELPKDTPGRKPINGAKSVSGAKLNKTDAIKAAGITKKQAYEAQKVAAVIKKQPPGKRLRLRDVRQIIKKEGRTDRERQLAEATKRASAELGSKLYGVIYADPPWRFQPYSEETGSDRAADNHYPTMTIDDIAKIELPAAADCVLFMWATVPMLEMALRLMTRWGFAYKSACAWHKTAIGTGYWFRNQLELLLVGTRGNVPAPVMGEQPSQVFTLERGRHSEKPNAFAEMIETMFPSVPKLEMFARSKRSGWDSWGNQAT